MKQTKLRRRRVIRYAILYFVLLVVILALIIGPAVAGKYLPKSIMKMDFLVSKGLIQPTDLSNDDTEGHDPTGVKSKGYSGILASLTSTTAKATAKATKAAAERMMMKL